MQALLFVKRPFRVAFFGAVRTERDSAQEAAQQAALREVPKGLGQLWEQLLAAEAEANQTRNGTASGVRTTTRPQGPSSSALGKLFLPPVFRAARH